MCVCVRAKLKVSAQEVHAWKWLSILNTAVAIVSRADELVIVDVFVVVASPFVLLVERLFICRKVRSTQNSLTLPCTSK